MCGLRRCGKRETFETFNNVMQELLSPRQVAVALGVSESSLKRWCDRGMLPTRRTAGGHRRVPLDGVLTFLRETGQDLVRPDVLGLPSTTGKGSLVIDRAIQQMIAALEGGMKSWRCA